jgi:hypothetical protein
VRDCIILEMRPGKSTCQFPQVLTENQSECYETREKRPGFWSCRFDGTGKSSERTVEVEERSCA